MKSLFHNLALKCDFGADILLFRRADFRRNGIILLFAPWVLGDNVANLHYNVKSIMAAIVNIVHSAQDFFISNSQSKKFLFLCPQSPSLLVPRPAAKRGEMGYGEENWETHVL